MCGMRAPLFLFLLGFTVLISADARAQRESSVVPTASRPILPEQHPKQIRAGITAPELIHTVEMPGLAKTENELVLNFWVDAEGIPSHIRILHGGDLAQNEKIIDAVRQYRFKPAMENGKPVLVELNMQVDID